MRWIFNNEDRVWRDRGGRPNTETVNTFLNLILPENENDRTINHFGRDPLAGFIVAPHKIYTESDGKYALTVSKRDIQLAGYCVGDFVDVYHYEVITAWTHQQFRGMNIASKMYVSVIDALGQQENVYYVICDVIRGTYDSMCNTDNIIGLAGKYFSKLAIIQREDSYETENRAMEIESFERFILRVGVLYKLHVLSTIFKTHRFEISLLLLLACLFIWRLLVSIIV